MAARVTQLCDAIAASVTAAFQGTGPGKFGEAFAARSETEPKIDVENVDAFTVFVTPSSVAVERSTRESFDHRTAVDIVILDPFQPKSGEVETAKRAFIEKAEGVRDHLEGDVSPGGPQLDVVLSDVEHDPLIDPGLIRGQPRVCLSVITCTYLSSRETGE